jgi:Helicase conserved C-terminal domain
MYVSSVRIIRYFFFKIRIFEVTCFRAVLTVNQSISSDLSSMSKVDNVCLVVNYDLPLTKDNEPDYESYLHRIGRTGRFGRKGTAINLVDNDASMNILQSIERHFSKSISNRTNSSSTTATTMMIQQAMADPEALADLIEI